MRFHLTREGKSRRLSHVDRSPFFRTNRKHNDETTPQDRLLRYSTPIPAIPTVVPVISDEEKTAWVGTSTGDKLSIRWIPNEYGHLYTWSVEDQRPVYRRRILFY